MRLIQKTELVAGGNPAIAAGAAFFTGAVAIGTAIEKCAEWGREIGRHYYLNHNDTNMGLGPMNYQKVPGTNLYNAW